MERAGLQRPLVATSDRQARAGGCRPVGRIANWRSGVARRRQGRRGCAATARLDQAELPGGGDGQIWDIDREGQVLSLKVTPLLSMPPGQTQGLPFRRIGAVVGAPPETEWVQLGFADGLAQGFGRVFQIGQMTVSLIGKMITGNASSKHLSGPLTMAEQAGQSAQMGVSPYLTYLALISVSLGLLNLLPLPMLDGGHLMYYLWESLTGKPVSVAWQRGLQKVGLALLIFIMTLAFFNDLARLFN